MRLLDHTWDSHSRKKRMGKVSATAVCEGKGRGQEMGDVPPADLQCMVVGFGGSVVDLEGQGRRLRLQLWQLQAESSPQPLARAM